MKVRLSKSSTGAILFALILCQFAKALQHVDLVMCDETADSVPPCILHDSMGDKQYLHANATPSLLIKLPMNVLTELWLDQSKIEIITPSGDILTNGQEIISSQDRDRWTIEFNFQPVMNSDFGKLNLVLHIKDVEYRDTQLLHAEIKTKDILFKTTEKIWIPIEEKSNGGDNDHDGEAMTTENHVEREDPSAILHAIIGTLQNKTEVLQQKLTTTENVLSRYQMKYFHCLESKDDLNDTKKPELRVYGKGLPVELGITIIGVILLAGFGVMTYVVVLLRGSKLKPTEYYGIESDGRKQVIQPHSAVTFEDVNSFGKLLSTVQNATPDVPTQYTGSSQNLQPQNGTTTSL